jgi:hypothetical protein
MSDVRIFTSFDHDHDNDLCERFLEQSRRARSGFAVAGRSENGTMDPSWEERARRRIRGAEEVVVICGEHTADSPRVSTELRIAQEEHKPYFLLWGRRETMCTRPAAARPSDCMYSWTREVLSEQIAATLRSAQPREIPESCKRIAPGRRES